MSKVIPKATSIKNFSKMLSNVKKWIKRFYKMIDFHFFCSFFDDCWLSVNSASHILLKILEGLANTEILKFQTGVGFLDILVTF